MCAHLCLWVNLHLAAPYNTVSRHRREVKDEKSCCYKAFLSVSVDLLCVREGGPEQGRTRVCINQRTALRCNHTVCNTEPSHSTHLSSKLMASCVSFKVPMLSIRWKAASTRVAGTQCTQTHVSIVGGSLRVY